MSAWTISTSTTEFVHYGVLGMKWGVRKDRPTRSERKKRKNLELDYRAVKEVRKSANVSENAKFNRASRLAAKKQIDAMLDDRRKELEDYVNDLTAKYGQENVKQLKRDTKFEQRYNIGKAFTTSFLSSEELLVGGLIMPALAGIPTSNRFMKYSKMDKYQSIYDKEYKKRKAEER